MRKELKGSKHRSVFERLFIPLQQGESWALLRGFSTSAANLLEAHNDANSSIFSCVQGGRMVRSR